MGDGVVVAAVAAGRVVLGGACTLAPRLVGRAWVGPPGDRPEVVVITRALGVRDLLMGVGTLHALRRGPVGAGWLWAGALADGTDVVGSLLAWRHLPARRRGALVALAGAAAAVQVALAVRAAPRGEPDEPGDPPRHLASVAPLD